MPLVAIPLVMVLVIGVFLIPVHMIPAVIVAVLCVVPTRFIPNDGPFNALPPLALVMGIWVLRRVVLGQGAGRASRLPPLTRIGPRLAVYALRRAARRVASRSRSSVAASTRRRSGGPWRSWSAHCCRSSCSTRARRSPFFAPSS